MSQCATCHAGCCRSYVVPLTGADILRIMADQTLSFWDFACRWADPQGTIALKYAPHFFFRDAPQVPFVISLIQEASRNFPQTARCKFLDEGSPTAEHPLGISKCGIYDSRPSACRVFPTKFDRAGELAILCDIPTQGPAGSDSPYRLCSKPWQPQDLDPIRHVQDLVVARYEMDFFFKLARSWNARPGDWRLFPEFLQLVYANRVLPKDHEADAHHEAEGDSSSVLPFRRNAA